MTTEKLTDLDCVMLDSIRFLRKTRGKAGGPSSCGSQAHDTGRWWFDGNGGGPILVYRGEMGDKSQFVGDENMVLAEIVARCGEEDLDKRKAAVQQERLHRIWGGKEEYRKTFAWVKHPDHDRVDNHCEGCGIRGLDSGVSRCLTCREMESAQV